jgi:hypothetical protein
VQAADATGATVESTQPNPVSSFSEHRPLNSYFGSEREYWQEKEANLKTSEEALDYVDWLMRGEPDGQIGAEQAAAADRGFDVLRGVVEKPGSVDLILDDAPVPPFLRSLKEATVIGTEPSADRSWEQWLHTASDEQLVNFSQWYTERLGVLADPRRKAELVNTLKAGYVARVEQAMADGWIDPDLAVSLHQRINKTEMRFFSPFGHYAESTSGSMHSGKGGDLVMVPTVVGESISTHELGHVFAGVDSPDIEAFFEQQYGEKLLMGDRIAIDDLRTVLNEGYNEHVAQALLGGHPELVSPSERERNGLQDSVSNELYKGFREVFASVIAGPEGTTTAQDVRAVVDTMAKRNFGQFAQFVSDKWQGRNVLDELVDVATAFRTDVRRGVVSDDRYILAQRMAAHLATPQMKKRQGAVVG